MTDPHALNKAMHIVAGIIALSIGAVPLLSRKGGRLHRASGLVFAGVGSALIATAGLGVLLFPQPGPLAAASLSAGYQFVAGLRSLRRARPSWIDGVLAAGALALCLALLPRMSAGDSAWRPAMGYSMLGFLACIAAYDLSRQLWAELWLRKVRPLDHGLKMTGTLFAMLSAGLGNLIHAFQPYAWAPSLFGAVFMVVFVVRYIRRRRTAARRKGEPRPEEPSPAFA